MASCTCLCMSCTCLCVSCTCLCVLPLGPALQGLSPAWSLVAGTIEPYCVDLCCGSRWLLLQNWGVCVHVCVRVCVCVCQAQAWTSSRKPPCPCLRPIVRRQCTPIHIQCTPMHTQTVCTHAQTDDVHPYTNRQRTPIHIRWRGCVLSPFHHCRPRNCKLPSCTHRTHRLQPRLLLLRPRTLRLLERVTPLLCTLLLGRPCKGGLWLLASPWISCPQAQRMGGRERARGGRRQQRRRRRSKRCTTRSSRWTCTAKATCPSSPCRCGARPVRRARGCAGLVHESGV